MKNPNMNEIFEKYTAGEITLDEANSTLKENGSNVLIDPNRNAISENERTSYGLLDTGTGSLDKVKVIDSERLEHAVNEVNSDGSVNMLAYVIFNGNRYSVFGDLLVKIEEG